MQIYVICYIIGAGQTLLYEVSCMKLPTLSESDIERLIDNCTVFGSPKRGGQKLVFPCKLPEGNYAIKFMLVNSVSDLGEDDIDLLDEVSARAKREVDILKMCNSPYLIKPGPIDLTVSSYKDQNIVYFSEEWLEGQTVAEIIRNSGMLEINDVIKLGIHITEAINELWCHTKIHRDIKPSNILLRHDTGDFILLDMGIAFDLSDKSLTAYGRIPWTRGYISPEQLNIVNKRQIDFRSDLFCLGIVMYESITGIHPFCNNSMNDDEVFNAILTFSPKPPHLPRPEVPIELSSIICRLLSKAPNLRYRDCRLLIEDLQSIQQEYGGV